MTYLATPGQVSMGVKFFIGAQGMPPPPQKNVPSSKLILIMFKCMVSMQHIMLFS